MTTELLLIIGSSPVLSLLAKSTLMLGTGVAAVALARRATAATRHMVLAAVFASLLLLAIVAGVAPPIGVPIRAEIARSAAVSPAEPAPGTRTPHKVPLDLVLSQEWSIPRFVHALQNWRSIDFASTRGDMEAVDRLVSQGANVNAVFASDGSPLIAAARAGHLTTVAALLDRGADPDLAVPGDGNPLIMAAREGHLAVVTLLLDRGAAVDLAMPADENALIQASGRGHLAVVRALVARGADVNTRIWVDSSSQSPDGEWRSPLRMARQGGHAAVVAFLEAQGARE